MQNAVQAAKDALRAHPLALGILATLAGLSWGIARLLVLLNSIQ